MPSCKKLARRVLAVSLAFAFVAMPLCITVKGWHAELSWQSALAKDGKGKGGGDGNGSDKGNGQGEGNDKGGGTGKSGANGKGSSGRAVGKKGASINGTGDMVQLSGNNIDVLHRNGMRERVKAGRYLMKDGKGRTIIERRATGADITRLLDMID